MIFDMNRFSYGRGKERDGDGRQLPVGKVGSAVTVLFRWFYCCRWLLSGTDSMVWLGRAYVRHGYMLITSIMPRLTLPLLVTMVLVTACGGGGGSSGGGGGGPGVTSAPLTNVNLTITPSYVNADSRGNFTIKLNNYRSLPGGIENININAIGGGGNWGDSLSLSEIREAEGEFVISISGSGSRGEYAITVTITYTNGSVVSDFPIVFGSRQNRDDYEKLELGPDGIYLGPNYDGDQLADRVDPDDDNDGINDLAADGSFLDICLSPLDWNRNASNDMNADGCPDEDEVMNGGTGEPGGQISSARFTRVELIIRPSYKADANMGNFTITMVNYQDIPDNVDEIQINATLGNDFWKDSLSRDEIQEEEGKFVITAPRIDEYAITVKVFYQNGAEEPNVEIMFVEQQNRDDYADGGIYLGSNYDGDLLANEVDPDDDNDLILDVDDNCDRSPLDWVPDSMTDTDNDGCRDRDEDRSLVGVTSLDLTVDTGQINLNWINPAVAIARIVISWTNIGASSSDSATKSDGLGSGEMSSHRISGLQDANYTVRIVVHYDNGGVSDAVTATVKVEADTDDDGVSDASDNCREDYNPDQNDKDNDGIGDVCDPDNDNDGVMDDDDVDDDGDGLIEISTAAELDAVRHVLDGTGLKLTDTSSLDQTGCGQGRSTTCNGYELVNNISLADYIAETYPNDGWLPIGQDGRNRGIEAGTIHNIDCPAANEAKTFRAIFEGNGFVIKGLSINRPGQNCIGLFGVMRNGQNTAIRNLGVIADSIRGQHAVGALVGYMQAVAGGDFPVLIDSSYAVVRSLSGNHSVGGLVGFSDFSRIRASYAIVDSFARIAADSTVVSLSIGGLVGGAAPRGGDTTRITEIMASYAMVNSLFGRRNIGGLLGTAEGSVVTASYVVVNSIEGRNNIGGLIGNGTDVDINIAYAVFGSLPGNTDVNPLVGAWKARSGDLKPPDVDHSYWDRTTSGIDAGPHGTPQTTQALRSQNTYSGIYDTWDDEVDLGFSAAAGLNTRCKSGNVGNMIWDLGTGEQYPAIGCTPDTPADQRAWWEIDTNTNKPVFNSAKFNAFFP